MNKYGERLKEYRKRNGLTQSAMAEKLSMPQGNYSRLEKGEQDIKLSMIMNICESLNIGTDWFLGLSDEYESSNHTAEFYTEIIDAICTMEENFEIEEEVSTKIIREIDRIARHYDID